MQGRKNVHDDRNNLMQTPLILVCLAQGTEEIEAISVINVMVRAGFKVITASADENGALILTGARGIKLVADTQLVNIADQEFDCIVLPGGVEGATHLGESALMIEMLRQQQCDKKWVAAICAAPAMVLEKNALFIEAHKTCHPAFIHLIPKEKHNTHRVYTSHDHHLITSQGPGTALEFAIEIVNMLAGKDKVQEVVAPMIMSSSLHYEKKLNTPSSI